MASSLSISRASAVMGTILERSIDIPRDISFRGNLTLVDRSGSGEAVLKQENLLKLVDITDGDVLSNKAIICNSDKNISGVNNQTNTGQFIFDKSNDNEEGAIDLVFKRARGSVKNKIETFHGNHIGVLSFQPYVGSTYIDSAGIDINTYKKSYSSQYSGSEIIFSNSGGSDINSGKHDSLKIDATGNLNILKSRELRLNVFKDTNFAGFRPSTSTASPGYTIELPGDKGSALQTLQILSVGYGGKITISSNNTGNLIANNANPLTITSGSRYDQNYIPDVNTKVNMTGGTLKENGSCSASNTFSITSSAVTASNPVKLTINPTAIEEGAKITVNTMDGDMGEEILTHNTFFIKITAGTVGSSVTELELYTDELLTNGVDTTGKTSTGLGTHTITEQDRIYLSPISTPLPLAKYYNGWTIETINPNSKRIIYEYYGGSSKEAKLSSSISQETNTLTQYKLTQGHGSVEITRTIVNNANVYTLSNYKPPPAPNDPDLSTVDNYYMGWTLVTDVSGTFYTGEITSYNPTSKEIIINWTNEPGSTINVTGAKSSLTNQKIIPASIKITSITPIQTDETTGEITGGEITGATLMDGGSGYIPNTLITMDVSSQTKLVWSSLASAQQPPKEGAFVDGDKDKLDGIEPTADITNTATVQAAGALMQNTITNVGEVRSFSSSDYATASQGALASSAQQPPSEGAFVNGDKTKLDNLHTGSVINTTNVRAAGALMDDEVTNLAQIKAFSSSDYATAAQGTLASSAQQPPSEGAFLNGDKTKLDTIDTNADVTGTGNVRTAGALMDDEISNLGQIKAFSHANYATAQQGTLAASAQQPPSEGAFVNGDKTKLDTIESNADVTDAVNVASAGALMESDITNLAQVKAFSSLDYATAAQGTLASSAQQPPSEGAFVNGDKTKLDTIDPNSDVTGTENVRTAGALMDDELNDLAGVKGVIISSLQSKLSEGAFVNGDKTKLNGIATGAEVNIQSDWSQTNSSNASYIHYKPIIPSGNQIIDWTASYTSGSKIDPTNLPSISLSNTYTVVSETTQLALSAEQGDIVIRTDETKTYVHNGGSNGTMADYTVLQNPAPNVTSVANKTGVVTLNKSDVGLTNVENTSLSTWSGNTSITSVGTIATGAWNANKIEVDKGGTGQTSYTNNQILIGNISGTLETTTLTPGSNISITNNSGTLTIASTHSNSSASSSGLMTSGDYVKLTNIDTNADVTGTENVRTAGALMDDEISNLTQIKTFSHANYATAQQGTLAASAQQPPSEGAFVNGDKTKLDTIDTNANVTGTENVRAAGALMDDEILNLPQIKAFSHANYATAAQGTLASSAQQPPSEGAFVDGDKTKLDNLITGDITDTINVRAAGALMVSDVTSAGGNLGQLKAFSSSNYATAAQGALADSAQQPPSEGAFENGDKTKLNSIDPSADVTDYNNVKAAGALMDDEVTNLDQIKAFDSSNYTTGQLSTGPGLTGGGGMSGNVTINLDLSTHDINGDTSDYVGLPTDKIFLQSNTNNSSKMPTISTFLTSIAGTGLTSDSSTGTILINNSQSIVTNISDHYRIYSSANNQKTHYVNIGKDDSDNIRIKSEYKTSVDLGIPSSTYIIGGRGTTSITISNRTTTFIPSQTNVVFTYPGQSSPETGIINTDTPVGSTTLSLSNISPNPTQVTLNIQEMTGIPSGTEVTNGWDTTTITISNATTAIIPAQTNITFSYANQEGSQIGVISEQVSLGSTTLTLQNIAPNPPIITVKITPDNYLHKTIIQTQSTNTNNDASIQFDIGNKTHVTNIDNDGLSVKKGFIESINIINGGSGYSSGDTVDITASPFGTTYTAEAKITVEDVGEVSGVITSIEIIKSGLGYSSASLPLITVTSPGGGQNVSLSPQVNDSRYIIGQINNFNARYDGYFKDLYISGDQNFQGTLKVTGQGAVELGKPSNLDFSEDDSNFLFGYEVGSGGGVRNSTNKNITLIGYKTGFDSTTSSEFNTFCGSNTGYKNTSGTRNTYIGYQSGYIGTTTTESVSVGNLSGAFLEGSYNTSLGANSGYGSSDGTTGHSGNNNVYLGYKTESRGGSNNLFAGSNAGELSTSSDGVFLGYQSGKSSTGNGNVLIGYQSGYTSTTSLYNVLIGYQSGYNISTNNTGISGNYTGNTMIGYKSGYNLAGDSSRNIIIGPNTGPPDDSGTNTHHNKLYISTRGESLTPLILGDQDTINSQTLNFNASVTISATNSDGSLTVEGGKIVFWGQHYTDENVSARKKKWKIESPGTTGADFKDTNIQIVDEASGLPRSTGAIYNTLMGVEITTSNAISDTNNINDTPALTGSRNSIYGGKAFYNGTSGDENTMVGYESGYHNISGEMNTFIGSYSGRNMTGNYNISIGRYSGFDSNNSGSNKLIIDTTGSSKGEDSLIYGNQSSSPAQTLSFNAAVTISKESSAGTLNVEGGSINIHGPKRETDSTNGKIWYLRIEDSGSVSSYHDTNISLTNHDSDIFDTSDNETYGNIIFGQDLASGSGDTTGLFNTLIGHRIAWNGTGNGKQLGQYNTMTGSLSARYLNGGNRNASFGYASLHNLTDGDDNTGLGYHAGYNISTGNSNSLFGKDAGYNINTGDLNICIGRGAGPTTANAALDKRLYIDASSTSTTGTDTDSLIYGNQSGSTHTMRLNADVTIVDGSNSSGNLNVEGSITCGSLTSSLTATELTIQDINIDVNPSVGRTSFDYNLLFSNNSHAVNLTGVSKTTIFGTFSSHIDITDGCTANTLFGYNCGMNISTGEENTLIGASNGINLTTGIKNTSVGLDNLYTTNTSNSCVGIGYRNLYSMDNAREYNIGIGSENCYYVKGSYNIGIGKDSLQGTSGDGTLSYCVGIGSCAGKESSGDYNHFIGKNSGYYTSGAYNIGMGDESLMYLRSGSYNIGIGHEACRGYSISSNRPFSYNVGLGRNALSRLSTGSYNICMGYYPGYSITIGHNNVCLGQFSGYSTSSGYNNIFLGRLAGRYNTSGHSNIAIGYFSGRQTSGSKNISIGYEAGPTSSESTYSDRLYIDKSRLGSGSLIYGNMTSRGVVINGSLSITGNLNASSFSSITGDITGGLTLPSNKTITIPSINQVTISSSNTNMYLGYQSGFGGVRNGSTTGNTYFGYQSGKLSNTSADHNTYIGMNAGYNGTSAEINTVIGARALYSCKSGVRNTCLGYETGYFTMGSYNTCIGFNAGPTGSTSSSYNLYIDPIYRRGSDSLIYGYGYGTTTRRIHVNAKFYVKSGYAAYATYWYTYSDISLKKDIFKIDEGINDKIDMLEPVNYTLKSNDKKDVGFIAQEVKKVFPLLVNKDKDGLLTVDYSKLTPYLVKGMQENNKKIKELESKLDEEKEKREKMETFFKEEIEKLRKEILRK